MSYKGFGKLKEVKNKNPKFGSSPTYLNVRIYDVDGEPLDLLFTRREINLGVERTKKNREDLLNRSWWTRFWDWMTK